MILEVGISLWLFPLSICICGMCYNAKVCKKKLHQRKMHKSFFTEVDTTEIGNRCNKKRRAYRTLRKERIGGVGK